SGSSRSACSPSSKLAGGRCWTTRTSGEGVFEEVEDPLVAEALGCRLTVPGGAFGGGELDELLLAREGVVELLGLTRPELLVLGGQDERGTFDPLNGLRIQRHLARRDQCLEG